MGTEREILKYEFDLTDAEAKAKRLQQLTDQIRAGRSSGGDTSELESQFNKELSGLGKLAEKKKEDAGATEKLLGQKEKLAQVVGMLGGTFGETAGRLGGLVQMLFSAGPAAAAAAAGMAALTIAVNIVKSIQAELEKAEALLKRVEGARRKAGEGERAPAQTIQDSLSNLGPYTPQRFKEAFGYYGSVLRTGANREAAASASAAGLLAGVTPDELAQVLATGKTPTTPEEVSAEVRRIRANSSLGQELQDKVARQRLTARGRRSMLEGLEIERETKRPGSRYFESAEGTSQDALLLEEGKRLGLLKGDATIERISELRAEFQQLDNASGGWTRKQALRHAALRPLMEYSAVLQERGIRNMTGPGGELRSEGEAPMQTLYSLGARGGMSAPAVTPSAGWGRAIPEDLLNYESGAGRTVIHNGDVFHVAQMNVKADQLAGVGKPASSGGVPYASRQ
jgi:hypothetical protein